MSESVVQRMQRAITESGDLSDGFMITQRVSDAMIQYKNHNEEKAAELLHQVFSHLAINGYPDVCANLEFNQAQQMMATVGVSDFVTHQIADSIAAMDNAHRACSALADDAVAALYIMALIHNIEYDLEVFPDEQSEQWAVGNNEDD